MRREFADGTVCREEKITRDSEKDQADINKIMKRAEQQGIIPLSAREGQFLDLSQVGDFREAREAVRLANEYFMSLPAESRAVFDNDAAKLLDAVNDPAQLQLLEEAGIVPKAEVVPLQEQNRTADGQFATGSHDSPTPVPTR